MKKVKLYIAEQLIVLPSCYHYTAQKGMAKVS